LRTAWPGSFRQRAERSRRDLREALIKETMRRAAGRAHPRLPPHDLAALTRRKLLPMVAGLFPAAEREAVLQLVERSVIFVTTDNIERLLMDQRWDHTAWMLANLHLETLGASLLSPQATPVVGLSEETTCYVSPKYFSDPDPASDFLVHEVAHMFHNCKRRSAGLPETRRKEWLLDIAFHNRETFAYACELYSWILHHSADTARRHVAAEIVRSWSLSDERVDAQEVMDIVLEAARSRAGWKAILRRCNEPASPARLCRQETPDAVPAEKPAMEMGQPAAMADYAFSPSSTRSSVFSSGPSFRHRCRRAGSWADTASVD